MPDSLRCSLSRGLGDVLLVGVPERLAILVARRLPDPIRTSFVAEAPRGATELGIGGVLVIGIHPVSVEYPLSTFEHDLRLIRSYSEGAVVGVLLGHREVSPFHAVQLGRAGLDMLLDARAPDFVATLTGEILERWRTKIPASHLENVFGMFHSDVQDILRTSVRLASRPFTVAELARACCCSERSLRRRLLSAGIACPSTVVAWSRLSLAAVLLSSGASASLAATTLHFSDEWALKRYVRRYVGVHVRVLAQPGMLASFLQRLHLTLSSGARPRGLEVRGRASAHSADRADPIQHQQGLRG